MYFSLGIKLTKTHKVLKFKQSDWIKIYINFNTEERKKDTNSFEKNFFKLKINSVYDETMENFGKRTSVTIVNNENDFFKYVSTPIKYMLQFPKSNQF